MLNRRSLLIGEPHRHAGVCLGDFHQSFGGVLGPDFTDPARPVWQ
jgi:hypothetical protein